MPGITRIHITTGNWNDSRMRISKAHEPLSTEIYREIFPELADGEQILEVTKDEALARYDFKEGVDVILEMKDGVRMTLQEKVLTWNQSTATFENYKTSGEPGAWFYCTAQLYFVAYSRLYTSKNLIAFQDWILLDYTAMRIEDIKGNIKWGNNVNKKDGRRASFRYVHFDEIPIRCIIARHCQ